MSTRNIFEDDEGWWYDTQDGDTEGPFKSFDLAHYAYTAYLKWLEHDHQVIHKMRDYHEGS